MYGAKRASSVCTYTLAPKRALSHIHVRTHTKINVQPGSRPPPLLIHDNYNLRCHERSPDLHTHTRGVAILSKAAILGILNARIRAMWADVYFFKNRRAAKSADGGFGGGSLAAISRRQRREDETSKRAFCINPREKRYQNFGLRRL